MGQLRDKLRDLTKNKPIPEFFKENSMSYYKLYNSPDGKMVKAVGMSQMFIGGIYFIVYRDESNWMQLSPIVVADIRDKRVMFAVNMNFLPLEIRTELLDDMIISLTDNNKQSSGMSPFNFLSFEKMYKKLLKLGFEYALVEYDLSRIIQIYHIDYNELPTWLYSQHPKNRYDPIKLYQIWQSKLKNRPERHNELIKKLVKDFYNVTDELIDNSETLKSHFQRLQRNQKKLGNGMG